MSETKSRPLDVYVIDIDETLINTERRRHAAWCQALGREIPKEVSESRGSLEILREFGFSDERIWERFWNIILCINDDGTDLLNLDRPIPNAAETLQEWRKTHKLIYLTGRTENTRQLTLDELRRFGFPTDGTDLEMFTIKDWKRFLSSRASVIETRSRLFNLISKRYNVVRVIDDYPDFFTAYKDHLGSDKIGLLRKKRFSPKDYFDKGATRVVENWKQLSD